MSDELMTTAEVADYLKVSKATVWRWCVAGNSPAFRIVSSLAHQETRLERMIDALMVTLDSKRDGGNDMTNGGSQGV